MRPITRIDLSGDEIPTEYYNILADFGNLPPMAPPLHPVTKAPLEPEDLMPLFPRELIRQEMSIQRFIAIPDDVLDIYLRYRPTPLFRARRLEKALRTTAKIFYKFEGCAPPGSHKPNTAIAQAYYNAKEGTEKLVTETGAGQWGTALAYAGAFFDLNIEVFMVRISYEQKPLRRTLIQLYGADIHPSPSNITDIGKKILQENPGHPGSLGIAISEAIERVMTSENAKYSLGSVLNHVLLHQTVIGLETKKQLELIDEEPDYVIGCFGGGSNFAGLSFPFVREKLVGKRDDLRVIAVESTAAPKLTKGDFRYDFGDTGRLTPLIRMYTVGHNFVPPPIHAGGLRYHGAAPTVSHLLKHGIIGAEAYPQVRIFEAAKLFSQTEGIIPAPESAHAIASVIEHARYFIKNSGARDIDGPVILFNLSGHGLLDLSGYQEFLSNKLVDFHVDLEQLKESLGKISSSN